MPTPERKPPAPMESRTPRSLHFTPTEWEAISDEAARRQMEPGVFARKLVMYGLSIVQAPVLSEASLGIPTIGGHGSQRFAGNRAVRREPR